MASKTTSTSMSPAVRFLPYAPALALMGLKDILDPVLLPFLALGLVISFVLGGLLSFAAGTYLFFFMGVSFSIVRLLVFIFPEMIDMLVPGVSILPLGATGVWAVYRYDKMQAAMVSG